MSSGNTRGILDPGPTPPTISSQPRLVGMHNDEDSCEEEEKAFIAQEKHLIETTTVEGWREFCGLINAVAINQGESILNLTSTKLPEVNSKFGKAQCLNRIVAKLKALELLDKDSFPSKRLSSLSKKNYDILVSAVKLCGESANSLASLKEEILRPFEEGISSVDAPMQAVDKNSEVNRIALLSWLLIYPPAIPLWESLSSKVPESVRPAFIEQPGGPGAFRLNAYGELAKVSEIMKSCPDAFDFGIFSANSIGADPAAACEKINPSAGIFKDGEALRDMHTSLVNRHKALEQRVYSSGFSKGEWSTETYQRAYDRSGESGKTKDVGLFYAFVVFSHSNTDVQWLVRDFADTIGYSSCNNNQKSASTPVLSKKDTARMERLAGYFNSPTALPQKSDVEASRETELHEQRMILMRNEETKQKVGVWESIVNGQNFNILPRKRQREATYELFLAARNSSSLKEGETIPEDDDEY